MISINSKNFKRFVARMVGTKDELNILDERTRHLVLLFGFSLIVALARLVYAIVYLAWGYTGYAAINVMVVGAILLNLARLRRRPKNLTGISSTFIGIMIGLSLFSLATGGLPGTRSLWVLTIPLLAFFLEGWRRGLWWTAGMLAGILVFQLAKLSGVIDITYTVVELTQLVGGTIFISLLLTVVEIGTEKYEHELRTRDYELQKFRLTVEAATDAVLMTDPEGKIIYVNQAWQQMTGYTQEDVLGKNRSVLQSGKTPPTVHQDMWQTVASGKPFNSDKFINQRKDGTEYPAEFHVFPVRSGEKNLFIVQLQTDISKRWALDRAKSEFVSLAAHQLTTPLSAIKWFTELLRDGAAGPLNEQQMHLTSRIDQSNVRMISLVNSLLNTSRIELGTFTIAPVPTDLGQLVRQEIEECKSGQEELPQISVFVQADLPSISVDLDLYRMIVQNLVTNALRYTLPDGWVSVELSQSGRDAVLKVSDNGIGIPPQDRSKVFSKLYRSVAASQKVPNGNGLGLYTVKAIIDQGGGTITFDSKPSKGTTFIVRMPLSGMKPHEGTRTLSREL